MQKLFLFFFMVLIYGCGSVTNEYPDSSVQTTPSTPDPVYKTSWVKNLQIEGFTNSSVRDNLGNFYFVSTDDENFRISKFDENITLIWTKKFDTTYENFGGIIAIDKDYNILLGGIQTSDRSNDDDYDIVAMKISSDGDLLWQNFHTTQKSDLIYDVAVDTNGDFYIVGGLDSGTDDEAYIVKYSSTGEFKWLDSINNNYFTNAHSVVIDENNNIFVSGITGRDLFFAKYLPDGTKDIYKEYDTEADERSTHMCLGKDGYLYVGGYYKLGDEDAKLFAEKLDKSGIQKYFTTFDYVEGGEYIHALSADLNGNLFLYGEYYLSDVSEGKLFLTQLNSLGKVVNKYLYTGSSYLGNLFYKTSLVISGDDMYISGSGHIELEGDEPNMGTYILKLEK